MKKRKKLIKKMKKNEKKNPLLEDASLATSVLLPEFLKLRLAHTQSYAVFYTRLLRFSSSSGHGKDWSVFSLHGQLPKT